MSWVFSNGGRRVGAAVVGGNERRYQGQSSGAAWRAALGLVRRWSRARGVPSRRKASAADRPEERRRSIERAVHDRIRRREQRPRRRRAMENASWFVKRGRPERLPPTAPC